MIELLDGLYSGDATPENTGEVVDKKKYGVTIDVLLGNIDSSDKLLAPTVQADIVLNGVKSIESMALEGKFAKTRATSFSAPDLTTVNTISAMELTFDNSQVATISVPKLKTVGGSRSMWRAFRSCPVTTVEFPELETVGGAYCWQYLFEGCSSLTTVSFPKLNNLGGITTQFQDMLKSCSNVTVHFPAAMETEMQGRADVQAGFGGTNTTVLFDL